MKLLHQINSVLVFIITPFIAVICVGLELITKGLVLICIGLGRVIWALASLVRQPKIDWERMLKEQEQKEK